MANYNKFETHNPYSTRFAELDSQNTIRKLVICMNGTFETLRDGYAAIQNDLPEGWSIGGTLSYVGLGSLAGAKSASTAPTEDEAKALFTEQ